MQKNGTAALENKFDALKASVKNLVDAGGEKASQFKGKAIDVKDAVFENSGIVFDKATKLVKAHPIAAIAVAFGAGYILMRVFKK